MAAWTNAKIDILVCALFFFPWLEWSINLNQEKSSNVMFSTTNIRYSHIVIYVNFGIITLLYFHCSVCYMVYDCTPYSNSMYSLNIYIIYVIQILVKHGICNIPLHHYFIISLFFYLLWNHRYSWMRSMFVDYVGHSSPWIHFPTNTFECSRSQYVCCEKFD